MTRLAEITKLTTEDFLNLDKVTVNDIVNYCMSHFDQDWTLIPPRFRTYKSYKHALRKTVPLWINIPSDIKNMTINGDVDRRSNLSSDSKEPIKSFILSIVTDKIVK